VGLEDFNSIGFDCLGFLMSSTGCALEDSEHESVHM